LSEKFGAKWLIGLTTGLSAILTLLNPIAARSGGIGALITLRILQGLIQVIIIRLDIEGVKNKLTKNYLLFEKITQK